MLGCVIRVGIVQFPFLVMLKKPSSSVLDSLLSSRTFQYAPVVNSSAALLESFFEHSLSCRYKRTHMPFGSHECVNHFSFLANNYTKIDQRNCVLT